MIQFKTHNYIFNHIETCNMCGHTSADAKILGQRLNKSQGFNPKSKTGIAVSSRSMQKLWTWSTQIRNLYRSISRTTMVFRLRTTGRRSTSLTRNHTSATRSILAKKLIDFNEGMSALDIGAGLGKCMISLERAGFDTFMDSSHPLPSGIKRSQK